MTIKTLPATVLRAIVAAFLLVPCSLAQLLPSADPAAVRIEQPSRLDLQYMEQQRARVSALFGRHLGRGLRGNQDDLESLQVLLDRGLVGRDDSSTLQAMGIVLGDVLAAELGLAWVIYSDDQGRSRALQVDSGKQFLFPVTMISRRYGAGAAVDVRRIYEDAAAPIRPQVSPDPFD